jgi:hypothetical protein
MVHIVDSDRIPESPRHHACKHGLVIQVAGSTGTPLWWVEESISAYTYMARKSHPSRPVPPGSGDRQRRFSHTPEVDLKQERAHVESGRPGSRYGFGCRPHGGARGVRHHLRSRRRPTTARNVAAPACAPTQPASGDAAGHFACLACLSLSASLRHNQLDRVYAR